MIYPITKIPRKKWKSVIDRVSGELRIKPGEGYSVLSGGMGGHRRYDIMVHIKRYMALEERHDQACSSFTFCLEDARRKANMQNYVEASPKENNFGFMDRMYRALASRPQMSKKEARRVFANPTKMVMLKGKDA